MDHANGATRRLRSRRWFDDPHDPGMTALYIERYMNYGITREELQGGKPIIGIAQTGSDLSPCNRHHIELAKRTRDGIRDAGGIPLEFPMHPIQETGKRPTAALDRNLAYLGLVEILHGYPLDGVVLTTGCDKTTPACLMGAATVNIPAIVLSGGPMLDGWWKGRLSGSGTIVWEARKLLAEGEIGYEQFMNMVASSAPSPGHCNTMGTATSMNSLAEALGMSLPGCAAIPGAVPRALLDGLRDRQAHRGDGAREPAPVRHHDQASVRERRGGRGRARRQQQLPDPHGGDRPPHGRGAHAGGLAAPGRRNPAAGGLPARRALPGRRVPSAPAACRR